MRNVTRRSSRTSGELICGPLRCPRAAGRVAGPALRAGGCCADVELATNAPMPISTLMIPMLKRIAILIDQAPINGGGKANIGIGTHAMPFRKRGSPARPRAESSGWKFRLARTGRRKRWGEEKVAPTKGRSKGGAHQSGDKPAWRKGRRSHGSLEPHRPGQGYRESKTDGEAVPCVESAGQGPVKAGYDKRGNYRVFGACSARFRLSCRTTDRALSAPSR